MISFIGFIAERTTAGVYTNSKGISRIKMPQIKSADVGEFTEFLKKNGVHLSSKHIAVRMLKPTQNEFDPKKVAELASAPETVLTKLVIVSSDGYILDGHHRYSALLHRDPKIKMEVLQADIKIEKLLDLAFKFPKTFTKSISESIDELVS